MRLDVLYKEDCLVGMRKLPADSVDAVVTDPPYGLRFMSKKWDYDVPSVEIWQEILRVLKPGGHVLSFGGTRTYHRMVCALEDAGFEIRDQLCWLYGSGFPKSRDVSKAIERSRDEDAAPVRAICRAIRSAMDDKGLKSRHLATYFNDCHPRLIDHWAARDTDSQPSLPTWEQWCTLRRLLDLDSSLDPEVWRLNGRKGKPGNIWFQREVIGRHSEGSSPGGFGDHRFSFISRDITAPATLAAKRWEGFGTGLKPAVEPIVLARKPPSEKTVAANVLKWGTGALNIDGCRIALNGDRKTAGGCSGTTKLHKGGISERTTEDNSKGRWPANLLLDEEAAETLDQMSGLTSITGKRTEQSKNAPVAGTAWLTDHRSAEYPGDSGGPSRFFYVAKASKRERGAGNNHPTVKPIKLLRYLVRLITPPNGIVLDPFVGSGSTALACIAERFHYIGFERDRKYFAIAQRRIAKGRVVPLCAAA